MSQPRERFFEQRETVDLWRHLLFASRRLHPCGVMLSRQLQNGSLELFGQSQSGEPPIAPPTRLTGRYKREAKGAPSFSPEIGVPRRQKLCPGCGKNIRAEVTHCSQCAIEGATQRLADAARLGREVARTPKVRAKQAASQRQQAKARSSWRENSQPA
jgi:hypothetical protein